ncbi:MAG TPA: hypothetical protein VJT15_11465 [Pyrinomonadaceae bacterium]|nr:hypothetical protein [Pyrinomonadaceae bacterium]
MSSFAGYGILENGESSTLPHFGAKVRVEVYLPKRHARPYRDALVWLIDELTALRGGCTVHENATGLYRSQSSSFIEDRICVVYSDFEMDWSQSEEQAEVLEYCVILKKFLFDNLWEEEILITAYPVAHVSQ